MDYRELLREDNAEVAQRYRLACRRIREIAEGETDNSKPEISAYFVKTAGYLCRACTLYLDVASLKRETMSLSDLKAENEQFYRELLPQNYADSYANPSFAVEKLGEEFGRILSFLYCELWSLRALIFEQNLKKITLLLELFLEIHFLFTDPSVTYKRVREHIYSFLYDNAPEWVGWRVREMLDPTLDFATSIIMDSDLKDLRYLYAYGEYICDDDLKVAAFLNTLSQEEIDAIAANYTEGYRRGFEQKNVDLSRKKTVNIRYHIGFERIIRAAILQFKKLGLSPVIYRYAQNTLNKRQNLRIGYVGTCVNDQYEYDHRFDSAVYLDKRMIDRKLYCMREAFEEYADWARGFAGPACMEVFGEEPFAPVSKKESYRLSERQKNLTNEFSGLSNRLYDEYMNLEERSFTIVAYPMPAIGEDFEDIFRAVKKVNTLDNQRYQEIQQVMIDTLDQAVSVHVMGRGKNMTNLQVALPDLTDPETQTKFENCVADVNIPVGEVFTSPKLAGTSGLLHVTEVYLNGLYYKDLRLTFEDGKITEYSCGNFDTEEEGKRYIEENLLFGNPTLPMGEFAIGTNTSAYVMATHYDIMSRLPILIAEKMGPHVAVGDTCYSFCEEVKVFNPDGKEMIARDNEVSLLRTTDPAEAYFHCHTDITIPYEELDRITCVTPDRVEIPIILDGRFALEGTFALNKPFQNSKEEVFS